MSLFDVLCNHVTYKRLGILKLIPPALVKRLPPAQATHLLAQVLLEVYQLLLLRVLLPLPLPHQLLLHLRSLARDREFINKVVGMKC